MARRVRNSEDLEVYTKILLTTLWKGGYVHEIIVCLFNKCFTHSPPPHAGNDSPTRPMGPLWPPRRINRELADIPLISLAQMLVTHYVDASSLPQDLVRDCFLLVFDKLVMTVADTIDPSDQYARKSWAAMLHKSTGETTLRDYFGKDPEDSISKWTYRVMQKVRREDMNNQWLKRPIEDLLNGIKDAYSE